MDRILYIEDDEGTRKVTTMILKSKGFSVIARENTDKADSLVDQWKPDLVITDHNLGEGKEKGLQFALRLHNDGVHVAMLSGNDEALCQAQEAGIPFFLKPRAIGEIIEEMQGLINLREGIR